MAAPSPITVGGNIFGRYTGANETARLLDLAFAEGINAVDTSDTYGDGESERLIGQALRHRRQDWIIATKVGLDSDEDPCGFATPAKIRSKLEASLRRLGTDFVDVYQLHHYDPVTPPAAVMATMQALVAEGKVRQIGVSNFDAAQLAVYLQTGVPIAFLQTHFNLLRRDIEEDLLPLCRARGIGVLVYGALGRGVLGGRYRADAPIDPAARAFESARIRADLQQDVLQVVEALGQYAAAAGTSLAALMVAWVLSRPGISSVVVGVRNAAQLRDVVQGSRLGERQQHAAAVERIAGDWRRFKSVALGGRIVA